MSEELDTTVIPSRSLSASGWRENVEFCNCSYEEDLEALLERALQCGDGPAFKTAYVEAVATHSLHRREGYATTIMQRLQAEISRSFELGALSPSDIAFYERLGWELLEGPLFIRSSDGFMPSPKDEEVMVLRLPNTPTSLNVKSRLSAEWREMDLW